MSKYQTVKIPNYILLEPHAYGASASDVRTLEAGTFVKPIERRYLPAHVLADPRWRLLVNDDEIVFCYTAYGIIPIPRSKVKAE